MEKTLVIFTVDHGISFPAMKCTLTDRGIGMAPIVHSPGEFTASHVYDGLARRPVPHDL